MGYLPQMMEGQKSIDVVGEFRGYNHNPRIGENEFWDMSNMTSSAYPLLSPREKRRLVRTFTGAANGIFAHEKLCWVDGGDFFYDGQVVAQVEDSPKTFAAMGAQVIIWPDKILYNAETGVVEHLGQVNTTSGKVTAALCKMDGEVYDIKTVGTAPENPANGDLYIDTGSDPHILRQWSEVGATWATVPTTYVKISGAGIGKGLGEYHGVTISGMPEDKLNGDFVTYAAEDDYIVVVGLIEQVVETEDAVTVERKIPDMEYVIEHENRLWGCSSEMHEIYACKLGDPKNWNVFLGIASDSYALTIGSQGDFTGAYAHMGYIMFFKGGVIHKIMGNKPANYQLTSVEARGVAPGSERSLAMTRETLFYHAAGSDVCAYGTAMPQSISAPLGSVQYHDAVGGTVGSKYYLSMLDESNRPHMFVYDADKGMWHREDSARALQFAELDHVLFFLDDRGRLWSIGGSEGHAERDLEWSAESGDIGLNIPFGKYIAKVILRVEIDDDALMRVEFAYDGEDAWHEMARFNMTSRRSFSVPIIPRRCDSMRIRLSGRGKSKVYSITKFIEEGSEVS